MTTEPVLPYSLESEQNVLGSIFLMPEVVIEVCDVVETVDFYNARNRKVYQAMLDLFQDGKPIDYISVTDKIGTKDVDLSDLLDCTPTAYHCVHHAKEVKRLAICRRGMMLANEMSQQFYRKPENIQATIGELSTKLLDLGDSVVRRSPDPIEILMRMKSVEKYEGIPLSGRVIQYVTGGLVPTELWVIGAFTSIGKTAFALQLAREVLEKDKAVCYCSLEMAQDQLMLRLTSNLSGVPMWKIRTERMDAEEAQAVSEAENYLASCHNRFWVYDDVYDIDQICYLARKHKVQHGLDVLFLDFIQNVQGKGEIFEKLSAAIIALQKLAKQLECCVVVLSQISNDQARDGMGDRDDYAYKGSGAIRDAADKGWMLKRNTKDDQSKTVGVLNAHLKKNRQGKTDDIVFNFEFATGRIWEAANVGH